MILLSYLHVDQRGEELKNMTFPVKHNTMEI